VSVVKLFDTGLECKEGKYYVWGLFGLVDKVSEGILGNKSDQTVRVPTIAKVGNY
jgi:hypothetical protein